jgi:glutamyl-tRNA reductase
MIIANRTVERAQNLADELDAYAIPLGDIPAHLAEADIVISSTASPLPILGKGSVERAIRIRKRKPILMVDIAVPRDIEPEVGDMADIYLYTVDDLQEIIQEGLRNRQEAADKAEEIIDGQVANFMGWMRSQGSVGLIREYRAQLELTKSQELEKAIATLQHGGDPEEVLKRLAHNLTNKLSHKPTAAIRQASMDGNLHLLNSVQEIFDLKGSEEG